MPNVTISVYCDGQSFAECDHFSDKHGLRDIIDSDE
jgi:hypothetical protein